MNDSDSGNQGERTDSIELESTDKSTEGTAGQPQDGDPSATAESSEKVDSENSEASEVNPKDSTGQEHTF